MSLQERAFTLLRRCHITEKSIGVYIFEVSKDATKAEVKRAVEQIFEVQVKSVNTLIAKGKTVIRGRMRGKRSDWKKAYVTLADGQSIREFEE